MIKLKFTILLLFFFIAQFTLFGGVNEQNLLNEIAKLRA